MPNNAWLLLILFVHTPAILAGSGETTSSAWIGLSGTLFDYEEFDHSDASLDRENGLIPGLHAGLSLSGEQGFVETSILWSTGSVDYSSPDVETTTEEDIKNLEILAGAWLHTSDRLRIGLMAGIGTRRWHRNILSTADAIGLDETYQWHYGLLGLRYARRHTEQFSLSADLAMTRTFNPSIDVDFLGRFDDASLDLGEKTGYRANISVNWQANSSTSLVITPWYEQWDLGRSNDAQLLRNGQIVGTVFEPRSETRNAGVTIGIRWQFNK